MKNTVKYYLKKFLYYINKFKFKKYLKNEVNQFQILFQSMHGKKYNDSPKAIFLEMLNDEKYKKYKFIWALDENRDYGINDPRVKIVKYASSEYFEEVSSSKYIVTSTRLLNYIILKDEQVYIQTWHGTPLKTLGVDVVRTTNKRTSLRDYEMMNKLDSYKIDYFISPSSYATEKFKSAFELKESTDMIEVGYPRNDKLINYDEEEINGIKEKLGLGIGKVVLYAPTWREDSYTIANGYEDSIPISLEELSKELAGYKILYRSHYMSKSKQQFDNVIDVSNYDDINDLYLVSDILVTDYSSVFFDYVLLRKPIVFYMYDLEKYKNETRGFYFDVEKELPGPIVKSKSDLITEIRSNRISKNYEQFIEKFASLHDGKSTKKVLEKIFKWGEKVWRKLLHTEHMTYYM